MDKILYSVKFGTYPGEKKDPFIPSFSKVKTIISADEITNMNSAVVLWGGEDINPSIYNQRDVSTTTNRQLSQRDLLESNIVDFCIENNIPLIGVCRGAQLLCAMAGGSLYQHVTGHTGGDHSISLTDPFENYYSMKTNSLHHQMMYPWDIPFKMLAKSTKKLSNIYVSPSEEGMDSVAIEEPEIVWFPTIRGLAIQGHPEFFKDICDLNRYCNYLIQKYVYG